MNQRTLKVKLEELVQTYFSGAAVVWGRTKNVQAPIPLICLSMGGIRRHYQPITQSVNGVPINCYESKTTLQIDLFTHGVKADGRDATTSAVENTAVSDLTGFLNFLNSVYTDNWCEANDVSILSNQVRDLTDVINDAAWECRAMAELEIGFTQTASGFTGIDYEGGAAFDEDGNPLPPGPYIPTTSGGGSQDLADQFTGWFERVEPEYEREESSNG